MFISTTKRERGGESSKEWDFTACFGKKPRYFTEHNIFGHYHRDREQSLGGESELSRRKIKSEKNNGRNFKQKANFIKAPTVKINDYGQTSLKLCFSF